MLMGMSKTVRKLNLSNNNLGDVITSNLAVCLGWIPSGVTSIDLSKNKLNNKTDQELISILNSMSATLTSINLDCNELFNFKITPEILPQRFFKTDERFLALTRIREASVLSLKGNGGSELSRIIVPMLEIYAQKLNKSFAVANNIMQFILGDNRSFNMVNQKGVPGGRVFEFLTRPGYLDAARTKAKDDEGTSSRNDETTLRV
jgi:hypothetical protein